jgi:Sec7-like guanine-nucleotide exchange factor
MSLSKKSKLILVFIVIGITISFMAYKYVMKSPEKIETKEVFFDGLAFNFLTKVQEDVTVWQNKVVNIKGEITTIDSKGITLENQIYCQFREDVNFSSLKIDTQIILKGRVIGYDDLLEEIKLDQCIIIP